jgi:hypothetical protein
MTESIAGRGTYLAKHPTRRTVLGSMVGLGLPGITGWPGDYPSGVQSLHRRP